MGISVIDAGFGPGISGVPTSGGGGGYNPATLDLGDWSAAPDGRFDGDFGTDNNNIIWRWSEPTNAAAKGCWLRASPFGNSMLVPAVHYGIYEEDPSAAGWTEAVATGGAIDYDTTVAGKIAIRAGSSAANNSDIRIGSARAVARQAILMEQISLSNVGGTTNCADVSLVQTGSKRGLLLWAAAGVNATNWYLPLSGGPSNTGIAFGTPTTIEMYRNGTTVHVYTNRSASPVYTATTFAEQATSLTAGAIVTALYPIGGAQTTMSFDGIHMISM